MQNVNISVTNVLLNAGKSRLHSLFLAFKGLKKHACLINENSCHIHLAIENTGAH